MKVKTTSLDRIREYLQDDRKSLSTALTERLERIDVADVLIRNGNSPKRVAAMLMKRFKDVSRSTAYRIMDDARYVYGSISRNDREYWRGVAIEQILETKRLALKKEDVRAAASCDANFIKATGLEHNDPELPDFSKLQPPAQLITLSPEFFERFGQFVDPVVMDKLRKVLQTVIPRHVDITPFQEGHVESDGLSSSDESED